MVDWTGAQAAVIGAALIDGDCAAEILAEMRPEDFTGEYRRYYEAFARLVAENTAVDPVTVLNVIGPAYRERTQTLIAQTPTAANVSAYITVCKEQSRLELLRRCGTEISGAVTLAEAKEALDRAAGVSLDAARQTSWTAGEATTEWFEALNRGEKPEYLKVGIGSLDSTLRTVAGDYVVVAGYTSHGKSAMALQMAWAISGAKRVGYFALEGSKAQWTSRLISYVSKVPLRKVQDRDVAGEEARRCAQACGEISSHALNIVITIFNQNKEEGRMQILHIVQRIRWSLLRAGVIGKSFDVLWPLEYLIYPDETEWNHMGEMSVMFSTPTVERDLPELHGLKWN